MKEDKKTILKVLARRIINVWELDKDKLVACQSRLLSESDLWTKTFRWKNLELAIAISQLKIEIVKSLFGLKGVACGN